MRCKLSFFHSFMNERTNLVLKQLDISPKLKVTEIDCIVRRDQVGCDAKFRILCETARVGIQLADWMQRMERVRDYSYAAFTRLLGFELQYVTLQLYIQNKEARKEEIVFPPPDYVPYSMLTHLSEMQPQLGIVNASNEPYGTVTSLLTALLTSV